MQVNVTFLILGGYSVEDILYTAWSFSTKNSQVLIYNEHYWPIKYEMNTKVACPCHETLDCKSVLTDHDIRLGEMLPEHPNLKGFIAGKYVVPIPSGTYADPETLIEFTQKGRRYRKSIITPMTHNVFTNEERVPDKDNEEFLPCAYNVDFLNALPWFDYSVNSFSQLVTVTSISKTTNKDFFLFTEIYDENNMPGDQ